MSFSRPFQPASPARGVTLIMVAGVLAVLAALGTGFYSMMVMQTKSAIRYADSVRAELAAKGGVEVAIAKLRQQAIERTESPADPWYMYDYQNGGRKRISFAARSDNQLDDNGNGQVDEEEEYESYSGAIGNSSSPNSDRYILRISDASSKINVNACDNLAVVLDNLCRLIGPPLCAADLNLLQPRRWGSAPVGEGGPLQYDSNAEDTRDRRDLYFRLYDPAGALTTDGTGRPKWDPATGRALFGDGYAIAGYRARKGRFRNIDELKDALTYVKRAGASAQDREMERLEIEVKFAALRDYLTVDSWVDTNTVCVGKFEWINFDSGKGATYAIDRDKSWVSSVDDKGNPIADPNNERGTLRGCYVSIVNGHGAGQLRRIRENGMDWIQIDWKQGEDGFVVQPGPISSYMIVAREDAPLVDFNGSTVSDPPPAGTTTFPKLNADGTLVDSPAINYQLHPLCIHRAPVNINTASDKVLAALFMGINVQHGHPMAIGTDADIQKLRVIDIATGMLQSAPPAGGWAGTSQWKCGEFATRAHMPYLLTLKGLKLIPVDTGKPVLSCPNPWPAADDAKFDYIKNFGQLGTPNFVVAGGQVNEAHELAYRIITARQRKIDPATGKPATAPDPDPTTADSAKGFPGYEKGPFRSWDDLYFRVVKPWDDARLDPVKNTNALKKTSVARMIMAHFNSNTDILKFNPNIEWIDRWGRNFTELEPVTALDPASPGEPRFYGSGSNSMFAGYPSDNGRGQGAYFARTYRYKSDEMLDKTDLNRSTTEFSFDSGGIYEIQSLGQVMRRGELLAERRVDALVKVYDVWRESTQRQFVQGAVFRGPAAADASIARNSLLGTHYAGQPTRHTAVTAPDQLSPLVTWPEPLVPLDYKNNNPNLQDVVCATHYDAWGVNAKPTGVPDSIFNKIQPAGWDGQIALATNTTDFDPNGDMCSFAASFNGDLDAENSALSGRELSKTPRNRKLRVLDTISLLGLMNDKEIDFDPESYGTYNSGGAPNNGAVLFYVNSNTIFLPLNKNNYWENVTCRMGDLRTEGVFLGNVGTSGKDATFKYEAVKVGAVTGKRNYDPFNQGQNSTGKTGQGHTVMMWFKSTWHHDDHIEHEFFNATGKGTAYGARYNNLVKYGQYSWACSDVGGRGGSGGGGHASDNCLSYILENRADADWKSYLHGGTTRVTPYPTRESSSFHVQPFRWGFVGGRGNPKATGPTQGRTGHWTTTTTARDDFITNRLRAFIDTARDPEGSASFNARYYWAQVDAGSLGTDSGQGVDKIQPGAWTGGNINADADGTAQSVHVFSANNLNNSMTEWLYRGTPLDGTLAVIDELKVTCDGWTLDRIGQEMTKSRYYLPKDLPPPVLGNAATIRPSCPQFISQSLLQSLRGYDKTTSLETVTLARVSWNVFTPRFLWEAKAINVRTRNEMIKGVSAPANFRGPFDYIQYNMDILPPDGEAGFNPPALVGGAAGGVNPLSVDRPTPADYGGQAHATRGVEVELLDGDYPDQNQAPIGNLTFTDPDVFNRIHDGSAAMNPVTLKTSRIRYRVRFRFPFDDLVAKYYTINPLSVTTGNFYLLDTPVFDDISVTYFSKPRTLSYKEVTE